MLKYLILTSKKTKLYFIQDTLQTLKESFMSKYESIGKKAIENQNLDTNITTINLPSYTRKRYYLGSSGASLEHENSASFDLITCPAGMLKKAFHYS